MAINNNALFAWNIMFQKTDAMTHFPAHEEIEHFFRVINCSKYCFQMEKGAEKGRLHYQCSIVLKEKLNKRQLQDKIRYRLSDYICEGWCTLQPSHSQSDCDIYCTKVDTRVAGPWWYPEHKYTGGDLVPEDKMFPWQKQILMKLNGVAHPREIICIIDEVGNSGKSTFVKTICYRPDSKAILLPIGLSAAQMKASLLTAGEQKIYFIDIPRNSNDENKLFDVIEDLKKGHVCSSFHGHYNQMFINRPHVVLFSNKIPQLFRLSFDMWKLYRIGRGDKDLQPLDTFHELNIQIMNNKVLKDKQNEGV